MILSIIVLSLMALDPSLHFKCRIWLWWRKTKLYRLSHRNQFVSSTHPAVCLEPASGGRLRNCIVLNYDWTTVVCGRCLVMISYLSDEKAEFEIAVWLLDRKGWSAGRGLWGGFTVWCEWMSEEVKRWRGEGVHSPHSMKTNKCVCHVERFPSEFN